jgi:hypothetical protein
VYVNGVGKLKPNITLLLKVDGDKGQLVDAVPLGENEILPEPVAVITTPLYTTEVPTCGNISTVEQSCGAGVCVGVGVGGKSGNPKATFEQLGILEAPK